MTPVLLILAVLAASLLLALILRALRRVAGYNARFYSRGELGFMSRSYRQRRERGNVALSLGRRRGRFHGTH